MKRFFTATVLAWLVLAAPITFATAGQAAGVKVAAMTIVRAYGNFVFIHLNTPPTIQSACSTNSYWHFTLSLDDSAGKNMYAQLLTAFSSGALLNIAGTDSCSDFGSVESVGALGLVDGA